MQVWVPIKGAFSTIFVCPRSALVPWTDITLKKRLNLQVPNFLIAASMGSLSCMCILFFFQENVILGSDYPFPLGEHHPGKLIEDVYKDDLELRVREQSHSVSRVFFLPLIKRHRRRCLNSLLLCITSRTILASKKTLSIQLRSAGYPGACNIPYSVNLWSYFASNMIEASIFTQSCHHPGARNVVN